MSNTGRFKRTGKTGRWPAPKPESAEKPTGRIVHDERGNAVWNFGNDTARHATAGASTIMRRLDVPDLQVEGETSAPTPARAKRPSPSKRKDTPKHDEGGGYNPYDAPAKRPTGRGR